MPRAHGGRVDADAHQRDERDGPDDGLRPEEALDALDLDEAAAVVTSHPARLWCIKGPYELVWMAADGVAVTKDSAALV